jgi:hypothetical protein
MRRTMMATLVVMLALMPVTLELRAAERVIEPLMPGWERFFKIDSEVVESRGRPLARGYVMNDSPYTVTRMQLLLDALDGSGRVVAQQISWLPGTLTAFSRAYFEIPVQQRAQAYRVRVLAYDRLEVSHQTP